MSDGPAKQTGLLAMLAGVVGEKAGHLILADWLDEHLGRADLAGVLRRTQPGPPPRFAGKVQVSFRYQTLDDETMLCLGLYQPEGEEGGYVVSLGTKGGTLRMIRWVRWLPDSEAAEDVAALWEQSDEEMPRK
jgi:hypothetical protein